MLTNNSNFNKIQTLQDGREFVTIVLQSAVPLFAVEALDTCQTG